MYMYACTYADVYLRVHVYIEQLRMCICKHVYVLMCVCVQVVYMTVTLSKIICTYLVQKICVLSDQSN